VHIGHCERFGIPPTRWANKIAGSDDASWPSHKTTHDLAENDRWRGTIDRICAFDRLVAPPNKLVGLSHKPVAPPDKVAGLLHNPGAPPNKVVAPAHNVVGLAGNLVAPPDNLVG
jgi:hypothetical protein